MLYRGLKEYVGSVDANYAQEKEDFFVGFDGSFGSRQDVLSTSLLLSVRWLNVVTSFNSQIVGLMLARALSFFGFKMYLPLKSQMCSLFIGCHFDLNLSQPCI